MTIHRLFLAWSLCASAAAAAEPQGEAKPWPSPVPGWVPVAPGEHPRLVFRKTDVPELRKRSERAEGKAILERLNAQLANPAFSTWHAAGYAFLYQITGDAQFARKALAMAEAALAGRGNADGRYTWPGDGQLRAGPCMMGLGLAYDLAYDGWDADARRKVAQGIMKNPHFSEIANRPRHCPGCNHWGAHTGGLGVALLALRHDAEADAAKIEDLLAKVLHNAKREIAEGYGRRGYYYEGHHCGRLSSNTGLIPFIQACRVAAGQDLVANSENAQWLVSKWVYEFADAGTNCVYNSRGMYRRQFDRDGMSTGGDFAQGFGICPEEHKPYVLWLYNHLIEPGTKTWDMVSLPFRAPYALANWPFDVQERCPDGEWPRTLLDEGPGYFVFRNGWKDKGNIVVTALMGSSPGSGRGMARGGSVEVSGMGLQYVFPGMFFTSRPTYRKVARDGSGVITGVVLDSAVGKSQPADAFRPGPTALAVDFSGASGADLLVAQTGVQIGYNTTYWLQVEPAQIRDAKAADTGYFTRTVKLDPRGPTTAPSSLKPGAAAAPVEPPNDALLADLDAIGAETKPAAAKPVAAATAPAAPPAGPPVWYVMTLQKGKAPDVALQGNRVLVGGQTLTFDGEKIVLGTMGD